MVALACLAIAAVPVSVFADKDMHSYIPPAGKIESVQDKLRDEAHAQMAMYVLTACIGGGTDYNIEWEDVEDHEELFNRNGNDMTVDTGYWYEKKMTSKYDDGRIKCTESGTSPVKIAAKLLDAKEKDLLCDGDSSGVVKNNSGYKCGTSDGKYSRNSTHQSSMNRGNGTFGGAPWSNHLQAVFDKKAAEERWEHRYVDVNMYYEMVGYYLYRSEIDAKCGGSKTRDDKPSDMSMTLIDVTQDGDQAGKVVYKTYDTNSTFSHEFVTRMTGKSCKDMIARANETDLYGSYRDRLVATLNWECRQSVDERKKAVEDSGHEINEETLAAYNAAVADTSNYNIGQFITGNESSGWKCADIGDFEGATLEDPDPGDDLGPIDPSAEANCYTNAGSLGWIVCPMITTGAEMIQKTYEGMVVPYLRMDPRLFASDSNNGTYVAWNVFRNIANLAFVIVFLVVIFSQLTGLGIDNYGIKKILPKLVVAAILINLSYIICQLAIDIANIVGSGIGSLFVRIGNDIMATPPSYCIGANGSSCMAASAGSAGGAGGWIALIAVVSAITVTAVLALGPQILIPVFLAILGIVIAVFFLFVVLGIRQAVAVLLVVASPLAFLCYMLPNTKKVFDRWLSILKGILIAYPVCSAMVYGGDMAAKILITSYRDTPTDLATLTPVLAAGIIAIAPIFLIPTVMKKSMGGIGMIASRISGSARHRATHAAGNGLRKLPFNNPDNNKFFGFGARAMHQRSRYKKQQREDNIAARQSEYNAKKGEKVLYGKKGLAARAAAGTLSASQKRQYNRALGAVNAERDSNVSTYTSSYKSMGSDDNIISSVQNSLDNGSLTADQFAAAVQAVHDEDKVAELLKLNSASGDNVLSKFKGTGADKVNNRQKIADALTSRKGNIFAQSAGKLVNTGAGDGMDFRDMTSGSNALMAKIQGAGDDVMASQDKDVFKIDGMGQMLSASQLAAGVGAGYSGSTAGNFNAMLYNSGRGNEVLDNLSADQLSRVSAQEYSGKDSSGAATSYSVMQALGGDSNTTNAANNIKANTNASTLIDSLNSTSGTQARSTMDVGTMGHLGVKNGSEVVSTSQYTDASGAGDHTIVQKSDGAFYRIDHGVDPATGTATMTETKVDIRDYKKK